MAQTCNGEVRPGVEGTPGKNRFALSGCCSEEGAAFLESSTLAPQTPSVGRQWQKKTEPVLLSAQLRELGWFLCPSGPQFSHLQSAYHNARTSQLEDSLPSAKLPGFRAGAQ